MPTEPVSIATLSTLRQETEELTNAVQVWEGRTVERIGDKERAELRKLESHIKSVQNVMQKASEKTLYGFEAEQMVITDCKLKEAVAQLKKIEEHAVVINQDSGFFTKLLQRIWAKISRKQWVEVTIPRKEDPSARVHDLCQEKFSSIFKANCSYQVKESAKDIQARIGDAEENLVDRLFNKIGFRSPAEATRYLENLSMSTEDADNAILFNDRYEPKNPLFYIEKQEPSGGGVRETTNKWLGKIWPGSTKKQEALPQYFLRIGGDKGVIKYNPAIKDTPFSATVGGREVSWKTWGGLKAQGLVSGAEFFDTTKINTEKEHAALDRFIQKTDIPRLYIGATDIPHFLEEGTEDWSGIPAKQWCCQLVETPPGTFVLKIGTKDGSQAHCDIDTTSHPGQLLLRANGEPFPEDAMELKEFIRKQLRIVPENLIISEKEINNIGDFLINLWEIAPHPLSEEEFKKIVEKFGNWMSGAYTIVEKNPSDNTFKVVYNVGNELQTVQLKRTEDGKIESPTGNYPNIGAFLASKGLKIPPEQVSALNKQWQGLVKQIGSHPAFSPYTDDAARFDVYSKVFREESGVPAGVWYITTGELKDRSSGIWKPLSWMAGLVRGTLAKWDFQIKKDDRTFVLEPKLDDEEGWKIKIQGEDTLYDSLDAILEEKGLSAENNLDKVDERFQKMLDTLRTTKPDYFKKYSKPEELAALDAQQLSLAKDLDRSIGVIVCDDKGKALWRFTEQGKVQNIPIEFQISGKIKIGDWNETDFGQFFWAAGIQAETGASRQLVSIPEAEQMKKKQEMRQEIERFKPPFASILAAREQFDLQRLNLQAGEKLVGIFPKGDGSYDFVVSELHGGRRFAEIKFSGEDIHINWSEPKSTTQPMSFTDFRNEYLTKGLTFGDVAKRGPVSLETKPEEPPTAEAPSTPEVAGQPMAEKKQAVYTRPEWLNREGTWVTADRLNNNINALYDAVTDAGSIGDAVCPALAEDPKKFHAWARALIGAFKSSKVRLDQIQKQSKGLPYIERLWLLELCRNRRVVTSKNQEVFNFLKDTLKDVKSLDGYIAQYSENPEKYGGKTTLAEAIAWLDTQPIK